MRLLLDESVPRKFRHSLPNHEVRTVVEMAWSGVKNGELLTLASRQFDALITVDKNIPFQQNLVALPIAVVILSAQSNELNALLPLVPSLDKVLSVLVPHTYVIVA
jgi:hypothetical protein